MELEFTALDSSMVNGVTVNGADLYVRFTSGKIYRYIGAASHYDDVVNASSVGKYINATLKNNYTAELLP